MADEIRKEQIENKKKANKISILKQEYDEALDKFQSEKETSTKTMNDLQLRLFNESHTRDVLAEERVMLGKKNKELQSKNQQDNRIITKDKYHNDREETARSRRIQLDDLQAQINKVSEAIELEQE